MLKYLNRLTIISLLLITTSTRAAELSDFIGNWKGMVKDPSVKHAYDVELNLWLTAEKELDGMAVYIKRLCQARVSVAEVKSDSLVLNETMMNSSCGNGRIEIRKTGDRTLEWKRVVQGSTTTARLENTPESPTMQVFAGHYQKEAERNKQQAEQIKQMQQMQARAREEAIAKQKVQLEELQRQIDAAGKTSQQQRQAQLDRTRQQQQQRARQRSARETRQNQPRQSVSAAIDPGKRESRQKSVYEQIPDSKNTWLPSIFAALQPKTNASSALAGNFVAPEPRGGKLKDLRGFWFVSGSSGSISQITAEAPTSGKQSYVATYVKPKASVQSYFGYRKGDIDSLGEFDIERQIITDTRNLKASGSKLEAFSNPKCRVIKGSTAQFVLQQLVGKSTYPGAKAYTIKRATPAHQICRYVVVTVGRCEVKGCGEMHTEGNIRPAWAKDSLLTNSLDHAQKYSRSIKYQGPSDTQLAMDSVNARVELEKRELKQLFEFGQALDQAFKQGDIDRQRRQAERNRRKLEQRRTTVKSVLQELAEPDATSCQPYLDKKEYSNYDELALFGVKLGMDLPTAHSALMCNKFRLPPNVVAYLSSAEKYFSNPRTKRYTRKMTDGTLQNVYLTLTPDQNQPQGRAHKIYSARFSHEFKPREDRDKWDQVRKRILNKYDLSGRDKERFSISYKKSRQHYLNIVATHPVRSGAYAYTIELCCRR